MSFYIEGVVIDGNKIGRTLGFPTANIAVGDDVEPLRNGVYAAKVRLGDVWHYAVANIGRKPSVMGGGKRILEVHIFDFDQNIYGRTIGVEMGEFIRDERRFNSFDELRDEIASDKEKVVQLRVKN